MDAQKVGQGAQPQRDGFSSRETERRGPLHPGVICNLTDR